MADVVEAQKEGRLVEAFAAGTAFFVAPVGLIHFRGNDLDVPMKEEYCAAVRAMRALRSVMISIW